MSSGVDARSVIASRHKLQVAILQWFISVMANKKPRCSNPFGEDGWKASLTLVFIFWRKKKKKNVSFCFPFPLFFGLSRADWWTLSPNNNSVETEICDLTTIHSKECFLWALFLSPWTRGQGKSNFLPLDIRAEWSTFDTMIVQVRELLTSSYVAWGLLATVGQFFAKQ